MKWWHIGAGLLLLYAISSGGSVTEKAERAASRREGSQRVSERVRASQDRERDAKRLSGVALSRYRANCTLVEHQATGKEVIHSEGTVFVDRETGFPLPSGTAVCNSRAWTAVLDDYGQAQDVAIATRHDSDENGVADVVDVRRILNGEE